MLKKVIKYTDYEGVERTETFYFNLNRAEVAEMELTASGGAGLTKYIEKIVEEENLDAIIKIFKEIILMSYGVKSADGKRFEKSDQLKQAFSQSEAYVELFMELSTSADAATAFINGILPQVVQSKN